MKKLNKEIQSQFDKMCATGKLYRANISGDELWNIYLRGFGDDPIFRDPESSVHNCNHCKNFMRRYGNIVAIDQYSNITTIFDINHIMVDDEYANSMNFLSEVIKDAGIANVFFETFNELNSLPYEKTVKNQSVFRLGINKNVKRYTREEAEKFGVVKPNEIRSFHHMHLNVPKQFVDHSGSSQEALIAGYRDKFSVFKRSIEEYTPDTLQIVLDLINQGSLLDGTTHADSVQRMLGYVEAFQEINHSQLNINNVIWDMTYNMPERIAKFRNTLIGVLCSEIESGVSLEDACKNWNRRVDPINYMKATAPITKSQIEEASKFLQENGYEDSFNRRHATIEDVVISEIKHVNADSDIKKFSIFDNVKPTDNTVKLNKDSIQTITVEKFMKEILPSCDTVEAYLENRMQGNLVSMTTAVDKDSKKAFKWDNNLSWTFNGNLAGKSLIRDAVKSRGGNVDGVLNIRLAFPTVTNDYDLHVREPNGNHIYYRNVRNMHRSSGMLDLDAQGVDGHQQPEKRVENITYSDRSKMPKGSYRVSINDYSSSRFPGEFTVEIEYEGELISFKLKETGVKNDAEVCLIDFDGENFKVHPASDVIMTNSQTIPKKIWGLDTNNFHKVNLVSTTPNHWGEPKIGNKHYLFMIENCRVDTPIRSFHIENLNTELTKHRKVMEVVGATNMINPVDDQLSGLGFNSTVEDSLIVRVNNKRVYKVVF